MRQHFLILAIALAANAQAAPLSLRAEPSALDGMAHGLSLFENPGWNQPSEKRAPILRKVTAAELPALVPDGSLEDLKAAILKQLARCASQSATDAWTFGTRRVTRRVWCTQTGQKFLTIARESASVEEVYARAKREFEWYQSVGRNGQGEVLFTGYYYPTLRGSWKRTDVFKYPLYRRPADLVQVSVDGRMVWRRRLPNGTYAPYYNRRQIDVEGALEGRGDELVYVDNPFDSFILQVQGSGQVMVTEVDGSVSRLIVNYAAQNGHAYVSIGSVLRSRGVDPSYLSLQGLRRYFRDYPDQLWPVMLENPSYVFFQRGQDGPYGSAGTILTPGHSVAVDTSLFPMGALALYETQRPMSFQGDVAMDWQPFTRLALTQDTGGAIRGAGRVDTYWGGGEYAEIVAGHLAHTGSFYLAVLPAARGR